MTHQKLAHGAWVFVGDDQKALFLINEGDEMFPNLRRLLVEEHKDPPSRELRCSGARLFQRRRDSQRRRADGLARARKGAFRRVDRGANQ
jgi:protein required for attachment to host cells